MIMTALLSRPGTMIDMPIAQQYRAVRDHIAAIARGCGRSPDEITLVAVSKTFPWSHVLPAYETGCRDFGENRMQEALDKMSGAPSNIKWHFIGTLQRKKVKHVVGQFHLIHSVDSVPLAEEIARRSKEAGVVSRVLLETNTSGEASKHGLEAEEWQRVFPGLLQLEGLKICGLMTMAPLTNDELVVRSCFRELRALRDHLRAEWGDQVDLKHLSMGMSQDYKEAIEEGTTLLRIGTAIFGDRE